ncbi:beta-barrel assembly-enhancing protease [Janthinobacterium sp. CG_23.3]
MNAKLPPQSLVGLSGARAPLKRAVALLAAAALVSLALAAPLSAAQSRPAAAAAPNLPLLGDTERQDLSPAMERKLGEEIMRDIRGDRDYLDDAPILEYLNNFGGALVSARPEVRGESSFDYFFFAVRDGQLNAFALPGGYIAVHSALLLAAQTESELASVLSHEIGHVAQRHIARMLGQQRQDMLIPLAAIVLAALASRAGGDAAVGVFAAGQGLAIQRQLNFGRDAEREADRIGFQIMGEAGFDTTGMVAFFGRMQSASRSYSDLTPAYLLTHPLTTERIADIQARIREQPYRQRNDSLDFQLVRARARVLQDESTQGLLEATAFFQIQLEQPGRFQQAAAHYGLALVALKRGDTAAAQSRLDAALGASVAKAPAAGAFSAAPRPLGPNAILTSMALEIRLAPKQGAAVAQQALREAEAARLQFPLSRGIARQYAAALLGAGQPELAARYLRDQVQLYRDEPGLHDLLAKTYAAQGKMALQHMALAESYALSGASLAALDQLGIARKASDASFYEMAVIDARERELQEYRREQLKDKK